MTTDNDNATMTLISAKKLETLHPARKMSETIYRKHKLIIYGNGAEVFSEIICPEGNLLMAYEHHYDNFTLQIRLQLELRLDRELVSDTADNACLMYMDVPIYLARCQETGKLKARVQDYTTDLFYTIAEAVEAAQRHIATAEIAKQIENGASLS